MTRRSTEENAAIWAKYKDKTNANRRAKYARDPRMKLMSMIRTNNHLNRKDERRLDAGSKAEA